MSVRTGVKAVGLGLGLGLAFSIASIPAWGQTPKRGGTLTYIIPADAPPSFDAR